MKLNIAQQVRNCGFGRVFLCCNRASWQYILYVGKPVYFNGATFVRKWDGQQSGVCGLRPRELQQLCLAADSCLVLLGGLDDSRLMKGDILAI